MHSDGMLHQLAEDILSVGVDVLNLQDLVNASTGSEHLAGRCCIELDVDRQKITPYGTPADIDRLIRQEIETLGSKEGGLCLIYGCIPEPRSKMPGLSWMRWNDTWDILPEWFQTAKDRMPPAFLSLYNIFLVESSQANGILGNL